MIKFRSKILFTLLALLIVVLVGIGLVLGQLFKTYYLKNFDEHLLKETSLVSDYIEGSGGIDSINKTKIQDFSKTLDARITLFDSDGNKIFETGEIIEEDPEQYKKVLMDMMGHKPSRVPDFRWITEVNVQYFWEPIEWNGSEQGFVLLSSKMDELRQANSQIWWLLGISFSFAFIVILILGRNIMNRYTKPIERATNFAFELAKGNYQARTFEDQNGEIGMLNSSLNILARNLQDMMKAHEMQKDRLSTLIENMGSGLILIDSHGYINLINRTYKEIFNVKSSEYLYKLYHEVIKHKEIIKIIEDIFMTEQKIRKQLVIPFKIERRHFEVYGVPIIGTNDVWKGILLVFHDITELKKLEQTRKDFVANVSHELRTPVTSIKGFAETLLDGAMKDQETLEYFLSIILKESDRLQSLIYDLLELSKIEKEGFSLSIATIDLMQILQESISIVEGKAAEKDISILFEKPNDDLMIEGDNYRLKQVFINIISNAVSYTPNGGNVSIEIEDTPKKVTIHVVDTGMGIEKEEIPRIFERFYRVNKARDRNTGGTGLGLAIVKHLLEAHKGKVTVKSKVGKGTTFSIELSKKFPI
ncbi:two-component system histidine kinase PnpS [Niallia sp. Krafla_26]|uniref:two-component system histidine kinase PnpS n=1 Tax=Niallia sp. Krafla_26 TaxID=3064703 RepID=UPI003D164B37